MYEPDAPLWQVATVPTVTLDLSGGSLPRVVGGCCSRRTSSGVRRGSLAQRSPLSTDRRPRVRLDPSCVPGTAEFDSLIQVQALRARGLGEDVVSGCHALFRNPTAKIMQATHPHALPHHWPRCTQMLPVSRTSALVMTVLPTADWRTHLTQQIDVDPVEAVLKIRLKPSQGSGRLRAAPEAAAQQLGISRRAAHRPPGPTARAVQDVTVSLQGNLGAAPHEVIRGLMGVVAEHGGDGQNTPVSAAYWTWDAFHSPARRRGA